MKSWALILVSALLTTGCSTFTPPSRVHRIDISQTRGYWFDYDATRRGAIMVVEAKKLTDPEANERLLRICAEPAPDVAQTFATKAKANYEQKASGKIGGEGEFATQVVKLAEGGQMSLFLREALFRLCELTMNSSLDGSQVKDMYEKIIDVALRLGADKAIDRDIEELHEKIQKAREETARLEAQKAEMEKDQKRLEAEIARNQSEEVRKQYEEQLKAVQASLNKKIKELEGSNQKFSESVNRISTLERNLASATDALSKLKATAEEATTSQPQQPIPATTPASTTNTTTGAKETSTTTPDSSSPQTHG